MSQRLILRMALCKVGMYHFQLADFLAILNIQIWQKSCQLLDILTIYFTYLLLKLQPQVAVLVNFELVDN